MRSREATFGQRHRDSMAASSASSCLAGFRTGADSRPPSRALRTILCIGRESIVVLFGAFFGWGRGTAGSSTRSPGRRRVPCDVASQDARHLQPRASRSRCPGIAERGLRRARKVTGVLVRRGGFGNDERFLPALASSRSDGAEV